MKKLIFFNIIICACIFFFFSNISVEAITNSVSVDKKIYNPNNDTGYNMQNEVTKTIFNSSAYTSLEICTNDGGDIRNSSYKNVPAFGINGRMVSLFFKINHKANVGEKINGSAEWMLCSDTWGGTENQKINGVTTGTVGSGAIVIQTSKDGINWDRENAAKYTEGLYTTDYYHNYGVERQLIYSPSGSDVSQGIFLRVSYAYEVYDYKPCSHSYTTGFWFWKKTKYEHSNDNEYKNYLEVYTLYLCNDNPNSITFHNLSLTDKYPDGMKDENGNVIAAYKQGETMLNDSITFTGFQIDKNFNLGAVIKVLRNGSNYNIPSDGKIKESGRYDISISTILGQTRNLTIYVDTESNEQSKMTYFDGDFITKDSKRIYSEGKYPIYEGGKVYYNINQISQYMKPLSGTIKNMSTGSTINISATREKKYGVLTEPGEYKVTLTNNPSFTTDKASGDARVFTYNFVVIKEGTSPGPQINKQNLLEYKKNNISDYNPFYYGITFSSAGKGDITVAFADYKTAVEYAYNFEKGAVERQEDGSYTYKGKLQFNGKKSEYNSAWDLTDALYYFAERAVTKEVFDLSKEYTYLSLDRKVLEKTENLRTLELERSVVVFANEEHRLAMVTEDSLPVLYPKVYSYLTLDGKTVTESHDFQFIMDSKGLDSNEVKIIDCNGVEYLIQYNIGVGEQLINMGCQTGIVTIFEKTIFGDTSTYEALFIKPNDNTTEVKLDYILNDVENSIVINQDSNFNVIEANIFSIKNALDELDSYSFIKVILNGNTQEQRVYSIQDLNDMTFGAIGEYEFICVNRLGFTYSFKVIINNPYFIDIEFAGVGTEQLSPIETYFQAEDIRLPTLTRYGYNFIGYKDCNGNVYNSSIAEILFKGDTVLESIWEAKQFKIFFDNNIKPMNVDFGKEYTLPIPNVDLGYKFISWTYNGKEISEKIKIVSENNINLIAKIEKTHSVIFFDTNGGKEINPQLYTLGEIVDLPIPVFENHNFKGWMLNNEMLDANYIIDDLDDLHLVAIWEVTSDHPNVVVIISIGASIGIVFLVLGIFMFQVWRKRRRYR